MKLVLRLRGAALALSLSFVLVACGGSDPPTCTGSSCVCEAGQSCDIGDSGCAGNSCSLDCPMDNECSGACGDSCSIDCGEGSECNVTVGNSSSVSCVSGSTCNIRCTGSCSLSCASGATCTIQCAADSAPRSVVEGGSCQ